MHCHCTAKVELPDSSPIGQVLPIGDTVHTPHGCYHASLLAVWRRAERLRDTLAIISDGAHVPYPYRGLANAVLREVDDHPFQPPEGAARA